MIINLGFPKSGTTTLTQALRSAGLNVADYKIPSPQNKEEDIFVGELIYQGYFDHMNPLHHFDGYDAISETNVLRDGKKVLWPQMDYGLLTVIENLYPEVKFVATTRDAEAICDSMNRWHGMGTRRLPKFNVPGLPTGWGTEDRHKLLWITGHYAALERFFAGRQNFLMLDVSASDAQSRLSEFIGRDLPWWGVANANRAKRPDEP